MQAMPEKYSKSASIPASVASYWDLEIVYLKKTTKILVSALVDAGN